MSLLRRGSKGPEVKELQERLKSLGYSLDTDGIFGGGTEMAVKEYQMDKNLGVDGLVGSGTMSTLRADTPDYQGAAAAPPPTAVEPAADGSILSKSQLKAIMPSASDENIDKYIEPLNKDLQAYGINTKLRIAHFIAQIAHESGSFKFSVENLNYSAKALRGVFGKYFPTDELAEQYARQPEKIASRVYASRMGNGDEASGEGWKFRGRGLIQLTGKDNYTQLGASIGQDLVSNPDSLSQNADTAVKAACWFWDGRKLNGYADQDDIKSITKRINGGYNGLEDREKYLNNAKSVLGI